MIATEQVCGRCGKPMPLMGFRSCGGLPRSRGDGNICYPAQAPAPASREEAIVSEVAFAIAHDHCPHTLAAQEDEHAVPCDACLTAARRFLDAMEAAHPEQFGAGQPPRGGSA